MIAAYFSGREGSFPVIQVDLGRAIDEVVLFILCPVR